MSSDRLTNTDHRVKIPGLVLEGRGGNLLDERIFWQAEPGATECSGLRKSKGRQSRIVSPLSNISSKGA